MSEETLLTAARRVVRYFNIDMNKGGVITVETEQAVATLDSMVSLASRKLATKGDPQAPLPSESSSNNDKA